MNNTSGLLLAVGGGSVYIILTRTLLGNRVEFVLAFLLVILGVVLVGLVLFSLNIEYLLERLISLFFLFWENGGLRVVIVIIV
jgi:hypothetical protein